MSPGLGKLLAIFFVACFLALQSQPVAEAQYASNDKQIFHIEDDTTSVIDKSMDNRFIYVQVNQSKHIYLPQQKRELKQQRQFIGAVERPVEHAFRQFMHECLAAICQSYQDKVITTFNYLQKRELSFKFNSILISNRILLHTDGSDSQISLS